MSLSSVGIATRCGLDGPGIESRWGASLFAPVQTGRGAHPASYAMGAGSFPAVNRTRRGVYRPYQSSAEVKERVEAIPLFNIWAVMACSRV